MKITLKQLIAEPLVEILDWPTDVWRQNLVFEPGERYQLDAPSGRGKTTLIHILCGLRDDFSGECRLDGRRVDELELSQWCDLRRQRLAVMYQDLRLFTDLTVAENLALKTVLNDAYEPVPGVDEMLSPLGMVDFQQRKVGTLSWGERQRIALVRTLSQPFEYLLLDEPFSHLDKANTAAACELIEKACAHRQAGCVMTTLGNDYPLTMDHRLSL